MQRVAQRVLDAAGALLPVLGVVAASSSDG